MMINLAKQAQQGHRITLKLSEAEIRVLAKILPGIGFTGEPAEHKAKAEVTGKVLQAKAILEEAASN